MKALSSIFAALFIHTGAVVTAYEPNSTQDAWDNHFAAFGEKNVTRILLDYDEDSIAIVFDSSNPDDGGVEYEGLNAIQGLFEDLFTTLNDTSDLSAPNLDIDDDGMVFLCWKAPTSGLDQVVDSHIFKEDKVTIKYQTIYINPVAPPSNRRRHRQAQYMPANSQEVWDNHLEAFGAQNVSQILLDYDENSQVRIFNFADPDAGQMIFNGPTEIEGMFLKLFSDLYNTSCLDAPLIHQDTDLTFLAWENPCTGFIWGTDTFAYRDNKIRFQNIALYFLPEDNDNLPEDKEDNTETQSTSGSFATDGMLFVLSTFSLAFLFFVIM